MRKLSVILCFFYFPVLLKAQESPKTDSLLKALSLAKEDTGKVDLLIAITDAFENTQPDKAKHYIAQAGDLSKKLNYGTGILKTYRIFAYLYAYQSKFDSVLYYNKLALEIARQKKDTFNIGVSYFNIGIAYRYLSDLESAVQYTLDGANLLNGKGYSNVECNVYDGLQSLYMSLMQYDKAIEYGKKAIALGRELKEKTPLVNAMNNLGLIYADIDSLQLAKDLYHEAMEIAVKDGNKSSEAILLNNLCEIARRENQFDLLKSYADRSLTLNTALADDGGIMSAKLALATYFLDKRDFKYANELAVEALDIADKLSLLDGKVGALGLLSNISFAMQDFNKGFNYAFEKTKYESKVFNESLQQKEAGIRIKYETEKKDAQIKLQQAELQRRRIINYILIGGAATLLIISLLSYRTYRQKQKLQQQRISELETEKQLEATEAVLKGEEQERTRLAKDLHDGLGGMLSGIKYSLNTMKGNMIMTPDNAQAFERSIDMLDGSIKEMRRVAHNMMPEALVRFGLDTALKDFCHDINQIGALKVNYQSIGLDDAVVEQTTAITIYRIVQELINNAMKHAGATNAIVQVSKTNGQLSVTVEDDGKGFDTAILKRSEGIGWNNIQNRVEFLKGRVDVNSQAGKGTSVHIELGI